MSESNDRSTMFLNGLDGSNPLAYLAALGILRCLELFAPEAKFKMAWQSNAGAWRPILSSESPFDEAETLCEKMSSYLDAPLQMGLLESLGENLTHPPDAFRSHLADHIQKAAQGEPESHVALAFLAAFGTDTAHQPHSKDRAQMQDTALRTMSGAGHQHFLKFMREIVADTSALQLYTTLFQPWTYEDEGRGKNLRWDPIDDRRYALRWKNPSSDPAMTMRGANRLAIEGLPFFPTAPMGTMLETTGFKSNRGSFWSWPIWTHPLSVAAIQTVLQNVLLTKKEQTPENAEALRARGIAKVFRSQRITVGKFRNFTPAKSIL